MTGLDRARHAIVEVATLITDDDWPSWPRARDLVVAGPPDNWTPWTTSSGTCTPAGLLREIESSTLSLADAGAATLDFLCGTSRGPDRPPGRQLDRDRPPIPRRPAPRDRGVPALPSVDVSTIKELAGAGTPRSQGGPGQAGGPPGHGRHPRERGRARLLPLRDLRPDGRRRPNRRRAARERHRPTHRDVPGRGHRHPDRSGPALRDGGAPIRGVPTRTWKTAPPTLRQRLELSAGPRGRDFLVYEDERNTFAEHFRIAGRPGPPLCRPVRDHQGDRVAIAMRNLPEWVIAFWAPSRRGRRRAPQRLVDRPGAGLRAEDSGVRWCSSTRSARTGSSPTSTRPRAPGHGRVLRAADETGAGGPPSGPPWSGRAAPLPVVPFGRARRRRDRGRHPPRRGRRTGRRRHHLLHLGHHREAQGAVGTHRNSVSNLMNLFFVSTVGGTARSAPGGRCEQRDPERQPPVGAALPRHRLPRRCWSPTRRPAGSW